MKKALKRMVLGIMVVNMLVPSVPVNAATSKVTIASFAKMLEEVTKKEVLKKGEFKDTKKNITRVDAAVLTNRADEQLNGKEYDTTLYAWVKGKKRIGGLTKIPTSKVSAVRKCYTKGLMVGDNKGWFSTSREFRGMDSLTKDEAKKIISRLKSKRVKISPDGQVIRTTKLPKNYKKYDYILATLPNSFYEEKFYYQKAKFYYKPVELVDYACPVKVKLMKYDNGYKKYDMAEYVAPHVNNWVNKIEKNLYYRLNYNYKTSGDKWFNELRSTYYVYGNDSDSGHTNHIKNYMKVAKANQVVLKSSKIIVEPSTMYVSVTTGITFRCYVEFKVVSCKNMYSSKSDKQDEIIYSDDEGIYIKNLKKGQTIKGYFDIGLASKAIGSMGQDFAVSRDWLIKE